MKYTAFEADEYDKKIRQTLPYVDSGSSGRTAMEGFIT